MQRRALLLGVLLIAPLARGHHSSLGLYDVNRIIEIEGTVTSIVWRNPHPSYTLDVRGESGEVEEWAVEIGGGVTTLRLRGVTRDVVRIGDRVRVAGEPSTRGRPEIFAHNLLLENGQEVLLGIRAEPRWPAGVSGNIYQSAVDEATAEHAREAADGIFRVWSADLADAESFLLYRTHDFPLSAAGAAIKAQWDPRASPYLGCSSRGMPYLMNNPYPIEFIRQGDDILLRLEMYDAARRIHMDAAPSIASIESSLYGYSRGRWDGTTLVVETDRIDAPYFDGWDGTPQSPAMHVVEYFSPDRSGERLDYRLAVSDTEMFTADISFTRYWIWRPDVQVEPFDCQEPASLTD